MNHEEWLSNEQHLLEKDKYLKRYSDSYLNKKLFVFLSLLFFFMPLLSYTLESRGQGNENAWFCNWCHNKNYPGDQWCKHCQRRRCFVVKLSPEVQLDFTKFSKEEKVAINDLVKSFLEMSKDDMDTTYKLFHPDIFGIDIAYQIASDIKDMIDNMDSKSFFTVLEDEEEEEIQIRR